MASTAWRFIAIFVLSSSLAAADASLSHPVADNHRVAALELFVPHNGSFSSLEATFEALRTFEILGVDKQETSVIACRSVLEVVGSSSWTLKDLFYVFNINGIAKCDIKEEVFEEAVPKLQDAVSSASSLTDIYYSIKALMLIKDQTSRDDLYLSDAEGSFHSIMMLRQNDGKWRYSSGNPESSTYAAGLALEALAGIVSLSASEIDQSLIKTTKSGILKLFDNMEKYDDDSYFFHEKMVDGEEHSDTVSMAMSAIRGITAFAAVTSGDFNIPREKLLGLAKFFLNMGVPGDSKNFFNQVEALACLENNRISIPLILSLPTTVLSLTRGDSLKAIVHTVLGSSAPPPMTLKLVKIHNSGLDDDASSVGRSLELKLEFEPESNIFTLAALPEHIDVGRFIFVFQILLHDPEHQRVYTTGSPIRVPVVITGVITVEKAVISMLDGDLGAVDTKKLDFAGNSSFSLSANHLEKLQLSFQLSTPLAASFEPHQAFLKLTHDDTNVDHVFLLPSSGKKFEIILDFLGLLEKFFYLSGRYDIQLIIGDTVMENSFLRNIGSIELDLPQPSEKKAPLRPPKRAVVDPSSRYGPKAEITHVFREPEKLPPKELSLTFFAFTLLPFIGFLAMLLHLGVNLNNFPSSSSSAAIAVLFHLGIAAVLLLYIFFWLKLDLFTTLKVLVVLGIYLLFVGHSALSHLASVTPKLKSM